MTHMPEQIRGNLGDSNQITAAVVAVATSRKLTAGREVVSRVTAELGRKGGKIGGKRSLETMTSAERRSRASKAAKARWKQLRRRTKHS